jgi:hypothetical protein
MKRLFNVLALATFAVCSLTSLAVAQGIQETPYSAADVVRRRGPSVAPDLTPSNPLGLPGSSLVGPRGSENISISSGMFQGILPKIPNLQLGYNYTFGPQIRAGAASVDYLLPFKVGADSTVYGEAHGELQSFSIAQPGSPNNSVDLCLGGGYRRMFGKHTMVGLHSFFDTTKLSGAWYSSGSAGVEMAAMVAGHDAIDLLFNWYGKALDATSLNNIGYVPPTEGEDGFGNSNFDFQVGYSHELYGGGPDLRLSVTGYKFDMDSDVYGYHAGAELKSRDGMFVAKYNVGYDSANQAYQSVAAFINMGFQLENLVAGKSPFVMPKPVFQSPREMTTITQAKVNRNWRRTTQTAQLALLSADPPPCDNPATLCPTQTITIINTRGTPVNLYMGFLVGDTGGYDLATDFPGWTTTSNPLILTTTVAANNPAPYLVITFPSKVRKKVSLAISADALPWTGCAVTQAEWTLADNWCQWGGLQDTYDISLVNGFNRPMKITPISGQEVTASSGMGNRNNPGVFGWGWTGCNCAPPPLACEPMAGEDHTPACPATPVPKCQLSQASVTNYTLTISPSP